MKAARQGLANAYQSLGYFFITGPADERDPMLAYQWYWLAVEAGNRKLELTLSELKKVLTTDQVAKAEANAREWRVAMGLATAGSRK